ncbi:barstar family protein [Actinoplanes sp. NPDC004185]
MSIPLRWRLLDEGTRIALTECADVDGLFVDRVFPAEPVYERYTLLSCAPAGPLLVAIKGTGPTWFGNFVVEGAHVPGRPVSEGCDPGCKGCFDIIEELLDVRVIDHRPSVDGSGLLDIDLEGHRRDGDNNEGGTVAPAVFGYRLIVWPEPDGSHPGTPAGECRDIAGLFHERPEVWPPGPPLTLLGCRPGLTGSFEAELVHVRVDGTAHKMGWEHRVLGSVEGTRPSALGDDLVDITVSARIPTPLAANDRPLWDMWRAGGPTTPNQWADLDRSDRFLWVRAAALHRRHAPDKPAGMVYHLDGRYITDLDGFFCAIGEAINGPGGWFGGDLFWLHENAATGDGGATPGFRLIWHNCGSRVAGGARVSAWRAGPDDDRPAQGVRDQHDVQ